MLLQTTGPWPTGVLSQAGALCSRARAQRILLNTLDPHQQTKHTECLHKPGTDGSSHHNKTHQRANWGEDRWVGCADQGTSRQPAHAHTLEAHHTARRSQKCRPARTTTPTSQDCANTAAAAGAAANTTAILQGGSLCCLATAHSSHDVPGMPSHEMHNTT